MGEYGFTGAQAQVLAELGSITEAAEVHQEEGRVLDAIRLFSSAPKDAESMKNAHRFLLDGFWKYAPLGTSSKAMQEMPEIRDILCEATRMSAQDMEEEINDEVSYFLSLLLLFALSRLRRLQCSVTFILIA